jgi:ribosome-binding ATPase YchF (GTP1/OBG family)
MENQLFTRIHPLLEGGTAIRDMELSEDDQTIVRNYQFLSAKPMVAVFNVAEGDTTYTSYTPYSICATIEEEIAQLDPADQPEFLESMGLTEPASAKVIRAVYDALGLITFFTAGENETRAWPLRRGSNALKAAATIHNDIAKGFIRAEIVHYDDYASAGSLDAAYSAGKMTLEGKEYVIRDGDLLHIRNKS